MLTPSVPPSGAEHRQIAQSRIVLEDLRTAVYTLFALFYMQEYIPAVLGELTDAAEIHMCLIEHLRPRTRTSCPSLAASSAPLRQPLTQPQTLMYTINSGHWIHHRILGTPFLFISRPSVSFAGPRGCTAKLRLSACSVGVGVNSGAE